MTQRVRVQNFGVSRDGIGAGAEQTLERPFGHVDPMELMGWAIETAHFPGRSDGAGTRGLEDCFTRDFAHGIGAEIMGRNKFGPQRGPWPAEDDWIGWWGEEPPFRTPVFVLTHHARPPLRVGETTFHFLDATPADALEQAKAAAGGLDVRIGGGVSTVRQFLAAGLLDEMHVVIAPVEYGSGLALWERPEELQERFHLEQVTAPSGVTHCCSGGGDAAPARHRSQMSSS